MMRRSGWWAALEVAPLNPLRRAWLPVILSGAVAADLALAILSIALAAAQ